MNLLDVLATDRVLPLFTPSDLNVARGHLRDLQAAGIRAIELTARAEGTLDTFAALRAEFPGLLLGAGTVLGAQQARDFVAAGADFVVSPCFVPAVAEACAGVPYLPGAGTVREVFEAQQAGAAAIKVFPGEVLGPAFVRAVLGPLPDSKLLVTGGVQPTRASLGEWLDAGALAVGLGSKLFAQPESLRATVHDLLTYTRERSQ